MMLRRAVGIDLGTTNALAAFVQADGHTELLCLDGHSGRLPCLVLFGDDRTIVGEEAGLRGKSKPQRLAACVKQELGKQRYSQPIEGQHFPPEVIVACILRQFKLQLQRQLGELPGIVIGVPASFNDAQRRAMADAADIAGLPVLDVLNEPVAAALAFAENTADFQNNLRQGGASHVMVYDLGGYNFEATLLHVADGAFTTLATQREEIGGNDWDLRLANHLAEQLNQTQGVDLYADPAHVEWLFSAVRRVKVALGLRPSTTVAFTNSTDPQEIRLTRRDFEQITADLLEQTARCMERLLDKAGLAWPDVSRVLLVGGASRMPAVRQMLRELTGRDPDQHVNPEESVARGTALYAGHLLEYCRRSGTRPPLKINNVSTHSLGIEGVDAQTGRPANKVLIHRGTPLPVKVVKEFTTKANAQRSISITVLEGESPHPEQCTVIGKAVMRDLPADLTTQWPVQVSYAYDTSGRLSIDAHIRYTDRTAHLEIVRPCGVSQQQRQRWKAAVAAAAGFDVFRDLAQQERVDEAPPPIAIAISPPPESGGPSSRILAYLSRFLPFAVRPARPELP